MNWTYDRDNEWAEDFPNTQCKTNENSRQSPINIDTSLIDLKDDFKIYWNNSPISKLTNGRDYLNPNIELIDKYDRFKIFSNHNYNIYKIKFYNNIFGFFK